MLYRIEHRQSATSEYCIGLSTDDLCPSPSLSLWGLVLHNFSSSPLNVIWHGYKHHRVWYMSMPNTVLLCTLWFHMYFKSCFSHMQHNPPAVVYLLPYQLSEATVYHAGYDPAIPTLWNNSLSCWLWSCHTNSLKQQSIMLAMILPYQLSETTVYHAGYGPATPTLWSNSLSCWLWSARWGILITNRNRDLATSLLHSYYFWWVLLQL